MTTFTLQDLTINDTPTAEEEEAMDALAKLGAGIGLKEVFTDMGKALADHEIAHQQAQQNLLGEVLPKPTLESVLLSIAEQFSLLATVISQAKAQPNTTPPEGNPQPLQETIELVLQQSDWFATMVEEHVNDMDFSDQIETHVERYCENYFSYNFDPRDHFDIDEAVADRVDDKLDDIVAEKVAESLEEVVAEKLSEASVSISF